MRAIRPLASLLFALALLTTALSSNVAAQGPTAAAAGGPAAKRTQARVSAVPAGMPAGLDAPMRIHLTGTEDAPVVVATIGDFAADLGDDAKFFVGREFVEHFVTNVLELGGPAPHAPMIAFLSQAEGNERECTFRIGEVSGRLSVLVTARRVVVMCSFAADEPDTRNLAALDGPSRETLALRFGRAG